MQKQVFCFISNLILQNLLYIHFYCKFRANVLRSTTLDIENRNHNQNGRTRRGREDGRSPPSPLLGFDKFGKYIYYNQGGKLCPPQNNLHLRIFRASYTIGYFMNISTISIFLLELLKGQIISKCLFGVFNFFQKTNENTSHSSKNEFIRSFFWKNSRLDNLLSKLTDL